MVTELGWANADPSSTSHGEILKKLNGYVKKTKVRDIMEIISKLKWNWAGHVARRTDNRRTTCITFWTPRGHTRNRGRPRTRGGGGGGTTYTVS